MEITSGGPGITNHLASDVQPHVDPSLSILNLGWPEVAGLDFFPIQPTWPQGLTPKPTLLLYPDLELFVLKRKNSWSKNPLSQCYSPHSSLGHLQLSFSPMASGKLQRPSTTLQLNLSSLINSLPRRLETCPQSEPQAPLTSLFCFLFLHCPFHYYYISHAFGIHRNPSLFPSACTLSSSVSQT